MFDGNERGKGGAEWAVAIEPLLHQTSSLPDPLPEYIPLSRQPSYSVISCSAYRKPPAERFPSFIDV
jgi:hypothetical protein